MAGRIVKSRGPAHAFKECCIQNCITTRLGAARSDKCCGALTATRRRGQLDRRVFVGEQGNGMKLGKASSSLFHVGNAIKTP